MAHTNRCTQEPVSVFDTDFLHEGQRSFLSVPKHHRNVVVEHHLERSQLTDVPDPALIIVGIK